MNDATDNVNVLIASEHPIFLEGMKIILGNEPGIRIVGAVQQLSEAPGKVGEVHPDVLLLDIPPQEHRALGAIRRVKQADRHVRILALTVAGNLTSTLPYKKAGVSGFIDPQTQLPEVLRMIQNPNISERKAAGSARTTQRKARTRKPHVFRKAS